VEAVTNKFFLLFLQGETTAPQDITSNIERSRHLDDPQQEKIYKAEVAQVTPGKQQQAGGGDQAENVAGAGRSVTGEWWGGVGG
jgi:hypothetical protein